MKEFKRRADGTVEIGGWAGTPVGDGTPLILFVLAGGKTVLHVETEGTDPDAAHVLALTDAGASNVKFAGSFACTAGEPIRDRDHDQPAHLFGAVPALSLTFSGPICRRIRRIPLDLGWSAGTRAAAGTPVRLRRIGPPQVLPKP